MTYGINFDVRRFYRVCANVRLKKAYLLLHSFELVIIMWAFILIAKPSFLWTAVAIGFTHHLILDQIAYKKFRRAGIKLNNFRYFFLFRMKHNFNRKAFIENVKTL